MNNGVQLTDPSLLRYKAYIDGQWTSADSGKSFAVTDPATGAEVTWVPDLGVEETRRAVDAAARAYPAWKAMTAEERAAVMRRWYR